MSTPVDPQQPEEIFGARLKLRREKLKLSQRDLADRMQAQGFDWHQTTVARTESARRPVRLNEVMALAGILRVTLGDLLRPEPDPASELAKLEERLSALQERITIYQFELNDTRQRMGQVEARYNDAARELDLTRERLTRMEVGYSAARTEMDELFARRSALRQAMAAKLKPGDQVDVSLRVAGVRVRQVSDDDYRFELLNSLGGVLLQSSPYMSKSEAEKALGAFMEKYENGRHGAGSVEAELERNYDKFANDAKFEWENHILSVAEMAAAGMGVGEISEKIGESEKGVLEILKQAEILMPRRAESPKRESGEQT